MYNTHLHYYNVYSVIKQLCTAILSHKCSKWNKMYDLKVFLFREIKNDN